MAQASTQDRGRPRIEVKGDRPKYGPDGERSWVHDAWQATFGGTNEARFAVLDGASGAMEARTNPDRVQGTGGYFAPPGFDQAAFAVAPRADGRTLADAVVNVTLPPGVQSMSVPRIVTGTTTSTEPDLTAPSNTDFTDNLVTSAVVLVTGESLVSQQLVDQSPANASTDSVVAADLLSSYNSTLEAQMLNGSGSSGQLTGLLNVSGINTVTYTDSSPTASEMVPFLGQAIAAVAQNRKTTANATFVTSSSRAAWFVSSEDTAGRPLGLSNAPASGQFDLLTYRTVKTDNMPRTINSTQEPVLFIRGGDCILYESDPTVTVATDQSLAGDLQLRIIYRRYCAFVVRYATAVTAVLGSGMTPVSGF